MYCLKNPLYYKCILKFFINLLKNPAQNELDFSCCKKRNQSLSLPCQHGCKAHPQAVAIFVQFVEFTKVFVVLDELPVPVIFL